MILYDSVETECGRDMIEVNADISIEFPKIHTANGICADDKTYGRAAIGFDAGTNIVNWPAQMKMCCFLQIKEYFCRIMEFDNIICAPATIPGTGAISIIRVSGKGCLELADKIIHLKKGKLAQANGYTLHFGSIYENDGSLLDEVIVSVFRAPHSYTGEDSIEISTHASEYIVSTALEILINKGCKMAEPGEFTKRAFLNGKMDLAQAEAVADVIAADSKAANNVAQSHLRGEYTLAFKRLRDELLRLSALVELELDFSEEDVEFADRKHLKELAYSAAKRMEKLRDSYRVGNALKNGVPIAIVGAPNAGKSTLLNALIGENRAIVSDIAGTTRDTIEESIVIGGVRYRFIDTAGLRNTDERVERLGIERSIAKIKEASIVICLIDAGDIAQSERILKEVTSLLDNQKLIIVLNKCDLLEAQNCNIHYDVKISALKGQGIDDLINEINKCGFGKETDSQTIVTSARHYEALNVAIAEVERVLAAIDLGISNELLAEDIRAAISAINSIFSSTSEIITTNEILGEIFGKFCVGK